MESPLAQRMERLWMSLLMMVASSSALRRSLLPPNGSSIEADWSRRKMKHPGFLRLISALYMHGPLFRLFRAFDLARFDLAGLDLLGRDVDRLALPILHHRHRGWRSLHARRCLFRLSEVGDRGERRGELLAEGPVAQEPADQAQRDEHDPRVKDLQRAPDLRASAGRTCRAGSGLRKPGQTTGVALLQAPGQH